MAAVEEPFDSFDNTARSVGCSVSACLVHLGVPQGMIECSKRPCEVELVAACAKLSAAKSEGSAYIQAVMNRCAGAARSLAADGKNKDVSRCAHQHFSKVFKSARVAKESFARASHCSEHRLQGYRGPESGFPAGFGGEAPDSVLEDLLQAFHSPNV